MRRSAVKRIHFMSGAAGKIESDGLVNQKVKNLCSEQADPCSETLKEKMEEEYSTTVAMEAVEIINQTSKSVLPILMLGAGKLMRIQGRQITGRDIAMMYASHGGESMFEKSSLFEKLVAAAPPDSLKLSPAGSDERRMEAAELGTGLCAFDSPEMDTLATYKDGKIPGQFTRSTNEEAEEYVRRSFLTALVHSRGKIHGAQNKPWATYGAVMTAVHTLHELMKKTAAGRGRLLAAYYIDAVRTNVNDEAKSLEEAMTASNTSTKLYKVMLDSLASVSYPTETRAWGEGAEESWGQGAGKRAKKATKLGRNQASPEKKEEAYTFVCRSGEKIKVTRGHPLGVSSTHFKEGEMDAGQTPAVKRQKGGNGQSLIACTSCVCGPNTVCGYNHRRKGTEEWKKAAREAGYM